MAEELQVEEIRETEDILEEDNNCLSVQVKAGQHSGAGQRRVARASLAERSCVSSAGPTTLRCTRSTGHPQQCAALHK